MPSSLIGQWAGDVADALDLSGSRRMVGSAVIRPPVGRGWGLGTAVGVALRVICQALCTSARAATPSNAASVA